MTVILYANEYTLHFHPFSRKMVWLLATVLQKINKKTKVNKEQKKQLSVSNIF